MIDSSENQVFGPTIKFKRNGLSPVDLKSYFYKDFLLLMKVQLS